MILLEQGTDKFTEENIRSNFIWVSAAEYDALLSISSQFSAVLGPGVAKRFETSRCFAMFRPFDLQVTSGADITIRTPPTHQFTSTDTETTISQDDDKGQQLWSVTLTPTGSLESHRPLLGGGFARVLISVDTKLRFRYAVKKGHLHGFDIEQRQQLQKKAVRVRNWTIGKSFDFHGACFFYWKSNRITEATYKDKLPTVRQLTVIVPRGVAARIYLFLY